MKVSDVLKFECTFPHPSWAPDFFELCKILDEDYEHNLISISDTDRISVMLRCEFKVHHLNNIDGRRYTWIASLWFDSTPVLFYGRAGKEGDCSKFSYILNTEKYDEMFKFIKSFVPKEEHNATLTLDSSVDGISMYGMNVPDYFGENK